MAGNSYFGAIIFYSIITLKFGLSLVYIILYTRRAIIPTFYTRKCTNPLIKVTKHTHTISIWYYTKNPVLNAGFIPPPPHNKNFQTRISINYIS